jgi:aspartokinase/homoserine dehydrogenase 1
VAATYGTILGAHAGLVTPNKKAQSGPQEQFDSLKTTARAHGAAFLYETSVGAGLPVIMTLHDLQKSGDRIRKIEAVLSGTLSFIFNSLGQGKPLSAVVGEARERGYTEPDPRQDLDGADVARKILILARECGLKRELQDVAIERPIPAHLFEPSSVEDFLARLSELDDEFEERIARLRKEGKKLCFIATIENERISAGLQEIESSHPFFGLSGSDNIIAFTTDRYFERPLVVKGPGAGAEVTAAGVFADLIRISNPLYG